MASLISSRAVAWSVASASAVPKVRVSATRAPAFLPAASDAHACWAIASISSSRRSSAISGVLACTTRTKAARPPPAGAAGLVVAVRVVRTGVAAAGVVVVVAVSGAVVLSTGTGAGRSAGFTSSSPHAASMSTAAVSTHRSRRMSRPFGDRRGVQRRRSPDVTVFSRVTVHSQGCDKPPGDRWLISPENRGSTMTDTMARPYNTAPYDNPFATPPAEPPTFVTPPAGPPDEGQPPSHRRDARWPRRIAGGIVVLALVGGGG